MIALLTLITGFALAAPQSLKDIPIRAQYEAPVEPLTTEKAWLLDPNEPNPHRKRWILNRRVDLMGVTPVELGREKYGVKAGAIEAITRSFVRGPGPWYRDLGDFRCQQDPVKGFATADGARRAAEIAARLWEEALSDDRVRLATLLRRISSKSGDLAVSRARIAFDYWLKGVEQSWRKRAEKKGHLAEWRFYHQTASASGHCPAARKLPPPRSLRAQDMMEYISVYPGEKKLLARSPARRWNGLYTIRMSINIAGKKLNGRFLIDTSARVTVVNPVWLQSQGIPVPWVELPGVNPEHISWSGGEGVARQIFIDSAEIGGFPLPVTEFVLMETERFGPPNEVAACCDGVIGTDILRQFAVEFTLDPPALNFWKRDRFHMGEDTPWAEVSVGPQGDIRSDCRVNPGGYSTVRWNTASSHALSLSSTVRGPVDIRCGNLSFARGVRPSGVSKSGGAEIGIPLLARGPFTLDLPHGRIWFARDALSAPLLVNRSGLDVDFVMKEGERLLRVRSLRAGSPASSLSREGLRPGMELAQVDDIPADEIDLWEVERRLAGGYGDTVVLQWHNKGRVKIAPLKVR